MKPQPAPPLRVYHVTLQAKATPADAPRVEVVRYLSTDYNEAWVGARTVCRLGTNVDRKREFRAVSDVPWSEAEAFPVQAGVWTVRNIFVQGTRKRGKQRMTTITAEQLLAVVRERAVEISPALRDKIESVLGDGIRITVASARRMGLQEEEGEDEVKSA